MQPLLEAEVFYDQFSLNLQMVFGTGTGTVKGNRIKISMNMNVCMNVSIRVLCQPTYDCCCQLNFVQIGCRARC